MPRADELLHRRTREVARRRGAIRPARGRTQPGERAQQGRLAGAVGAEDRGDVPAAPSKRRRRAARAGAVPGDHVLDASRQVRSTLMRSSPSTVDSRGRRRSPPGRRGPRPGVPVGDDPAEVEHDDLGRRPPSPGPCGARPARTGIAPRSRADQPAQLVDVVGAEAAGGLVEQQQLAARATSARASATRLRTGVRQARRAAGRRSRRRPARRARPARARAAPARRGRCAAGRAAPRRSPARAVRSAPAITFSSTVRPRNRPTPCSVRAMPSRGELVRPRPQRRAVAASPCPRRARRSRRRR